MNVRDAFRQVTQVFLDRSPVIYYVEAVPAFMKVTQAVFQLIEQEEMQGVVSPVTLAECITLPIRMGQVELQQRFMTLLTGTDGILLMDIDAAIGSRAAELRVRYGLKLPDVLQLAVALASGCEAFLTNDVALKRVTELRVLVLVELE